MSNQILLYKKIIYNSNIVINNLSIKFDSFNTSKYYNYKIKFLQR